MQIIDDLRSNDMNDEQRRIVAKAIQDAKFKNARLRHLKERHERYLAEQRGEDATDEDETKEL